LYEQKNNTELKKMETRGKFEYFDNFWGKTHLKFWNFVKFLGKYNKNSSILKSAETVQFCFVGH